MVYVLQCTYLYKYGIFISYLLHCFQASDILLLEHTLKAQGQEV